MRKENTEPYATIYVNECYNAIKLERLFIYHGILTWYYTQLVYQGYINWGGILTGYLR